MALGKIKADTLEHSTSGSVDTKFVVEGSAKAWASNSDKTGDTISNSLNVSSLTDESTTGQYTWALTNSATSNIDDFALSGMCGGAARNIRYSDGANTTSTNLDIRTYTSSSGSGVDSKHSWQWCGDLA